MLSNLTSPQASLAGSVIGGITSGIGMIGQVKRAKKIAQFENDLAVKNMKLQNEMNQENWMAQQEYNSPARQLQRMQEAGLNPNLMYQSSPTNVATSPQESGDFYAPNVENPDVAGAFNEVGKQIGGIMSNYMQYKAIEQNIKESRSRENMQQAQTNLFTDQLLTNAQSRKVELERLLMDKDLHPTRKTLLEFELGKIDEEISNIRQSTMRSIEETEFARQANDRENKRLAKWLESEDIRNRVQSAQAATEEWISQYMNKHGRKPSNSAVDAYIGDLIESYFGTNGIHDRYMPDHGIIADLIYKGLNNLK